MSFSLSADVICIKYIVQWVLLSCNISVCIILQLNFIYAKSQIHFNNFVVTLFRPVFNRGIFYESSGH